MDIEFRNPVVIHRKKKYYIYLLSAYIINISENITIPFLYIQDAEIERVKLRMLSTPVDIHNNLKFVIETIQIDFKPKVGKQTIWGTIK